MNTDPSLLQDLIVNTLRGILSVQRQLQEDQMRSDGEQEKFLQSLSLLQHQLEQILIVQRNLQLDQLRQQDQNFRLLDQIDRIMQNQIKQQDLLDKIIDFNLSYLDRLSDR